MGFNGFLEGCLVFFSDYGLSSLKGNFLLGFFLVFS